jgi:hypothetical protein
MTNMATTATAQTSKTRAKAGATGARKTGSRKTTGAGRKKIAGSSAARNAVSKPHTVSKHNALREGLNGPDPVLMKKQSGIWDALMDRYFRLEIDGCWMSLKWCKQSFMGSKSTDRE